MSKPQQPPKSLLTAKICLAIILVSVIIVLRQLSFHDAGLLTSLTALAVLLISVVILGRMVLPPPIDDEPEHQRQQGPRVDEPSMAVNLLMKLSEDDPERLARLQYLLHLINPEKDLPGKVKFALRLLPEMMPEKIFVFYDTSESKLRFISGARINSRNNCENIHEGDSLNEELAIKIRGCLDLRAVKQAGSFNDPLDFSTTTSGKEGLLVPVSFHGKLSGILACITQSADSFSRSERALLQHFAAGIALLIDNHRIFASQAAEKDATASHNLAQQLFASQLPGYGPAIKSWQIAQTASYTEEHGGDFHDYVNLPDNRLMIILGKASGKGINAAIFFTRLKAMIACLIERNSTPASLLNSLSVRLSSESGSEIFASVIALQIKAGEKTAAIAIAGHAVPLINRPRSGYVEIASLASGVPLGLFNQGVEPYENQTIQLLPGDGILLYTDGVLELPDRNGLPLSIEELKLMLDKIPEQPADVLLQSLTTDLLPVKNVHRPCEDYTLIYAKTE